MTHVRREMYVAQSHHEYNHNVWWVYKHEYLMRGGIERASGWDITGRGGIFEVWCTDMQNAKLCVGYGGELQSTMLWRDGMYKENYVFFYVRCSHVYLLDKFNKL